MKRIPSYLKNKFILAISLFVVYSLFLDEYDIFTMIHQNNNLNKLEASTAKMKRKLIETKSTVEKLKYKSEIERFAREEKLFKKDNEDVFVIFYE